MAVTSGYNWHFCGRGIITACSKKILSTFDKRKRYEINEIKWFNCGASLSIEFKIRLSFCIAYQVSRTSNETRNLRWTMADSERDEEKGRA